MPWSIVVPVVDAKVRGLCPRPYPLHPKGCPNFNHKDGCPPQAPMIGEVLNLSKPVWAIWNGFNFAGHVAKMREAHPDWSERQLACCLYWQPKARGMLRAEIRRFWEQVGDSQIGDLDVARTVTCPEACGVNLTATMMSIGTVLEWPPKTTAYQIVLAGSKLDKAERGI